MIGVDIVDLSRITEDEAFVSRILTPEEREELVTRGSQSRRIEYIGGRFAAKEALFKATGETACLTWPVLNDPEGKPYVKGHPEIAVSISHDGGLAIAAVQIP